MLGKTISIAKGAFGGMAPEPELESLLLKLDMYGRPTVYRADKGWHVSVEMSVVVEGVRFDVKSEFNHPTPTAAAIVCLERIQAALKKLELPGR